MSQRSGSRLEEHIKYVLRIFYYFGIGVIIAMVLLTLAQAVGRYAFRFPIPGSIELSSYMLIISTFLLFSHTMVEKNHIIIGIVVDRLSERTQAIIDSFNYIMVLAIAIMAVFWTSSQGFYMMHQGRASDILQIPVYPFLYIMAFGWGIFAVAVVMHLVHVLARAVKR